MGSRAPLTPILEDAIKHAVDALRTGQLIAYPTEAVFGFGCDPFNVDAVSRLLHLKHRSIEQGFILVAANWHQVEPLVNAIGPDLLTRVFDTWPGPTTWVFPASPVVPHWIRGNHKTIAIRVSAEPIIQALCEGFDAPIISTSANVSGDPPSRELLTLTMRFADKIDVIVPGKVGHLHKPTQIRDAITGEVLRD